MPVRLGVNASCPAECSRRRTLPKPCAPLHAPCTKTNVVTRSALSRLGGPARCPAAPAQVLSQAAMHSSLRSDHAVNSVMSRGQLALPRSSLGEVVAGRLSLRPGGVG